MNTQTGFLAQKYLNVVLPLEVMQSGRGYYIGTADQESGAPATRESNEYFRKKIDAENALKANLWTQKEHP
ncbi:hypothetical protein IBT47_22975 [Erwinia sp. S43]|uniref:hypothetical protein n=1 Tax=Erwinia sp. S43 TaxID=2769339 RepID=UPI00190B7E63|nr:hypothetical protein [Erwinia sp. S43]MBK0035155.1 hypothetical protein [Erwinia sp. S43]